MILRGGAGINCDDGIEFSSVRLLLSSVPLRNSTTRRAVFLSHEIHAPTIVVLHIEVPTNLARFWRAAPRQQSRIVVRPN